MKTVLHVGCGGQHILGQQGFSADEWREIRLDICPDVQPDIVANMVDMRPVADASVDAVYSCHNIEHLYWHEAQAALREFYRVLRPGGYALVICPDVQAVAELVAQGKLLEPAYHTGAGYGIAPVDMLWGWRVMLEQGKDYMAHKCGYTLETLQQTLKDAGFASVNGKRGCYTLTCNAIKGGA